MHTNLLLSLTGFVQLCYREKARDTDVFPVASLNVQRHPFMMNLKAACWSTARSTAPRFNWTLFWLTPCVKIVVTSMYPVDIHLRIYRPTI